MPVVSTDDMARRLRYNFLGFRGWRWPFEARFPSIGLGIILTLLFAAGSYAFAPPGTRLNLLGALLSPLPAVWITRRVMRWVDYDRPLKFHMTNLQSELTTPRPLPLTEVEVAVAVPVDLYKPRSTRP